LKSIIQIVIFNWFSIALAKFIFRKQDQIKSNKIAVLAHFFGSGSNEVQHLVQIKKQHILFINDNMKDKKIFN